MPGSPRRWGLGGGGQLVTAHGSARTKATRHVKAGGALSVRVTRLSLSLFDDFEDRTVLQPRPHHLPTLETMLDELAEWGGALQRLRATR